MPRHNLHLPRSWRSWGRAAKSEGSTRLFWPEIPKIMARDAVKTAGISRLHFSSYTVGGPKRGLGGGEAQFACPIGRPGSNPNRRLEACFAAPPGFRTA